MNGLSEPLTVGDGLISVLIVWPFHDGTLLNGVAVGAGVGLGVIVGCAVGLLEGFAEGLLDGLADGLADGIPDGCADGLPDGLVVGLADGCAVGPLDGTIVGTVPGVPADPPPPPHPAMKVRESSSKYHRRIYADGKRALSFRSRCERSWFA